MSAPSVTLHGFAYGEHLEGIPERSLGYRLLAPVVPEPWSAEVEALARRLQAAPYPDQWPPVDLFCSVLLEDGRRLLALARYGLSDHTAGKRRGGLEFIGVVCSDTIDLPWSLAVYRWLKRRRAETDDLRSLSGTQSLGDVVASPQEAPPRLEAAAILPIRLWQEGCFLIAAVAPTDPDQRLGLLELGAPAGWQWLPFVGADYPLQTYARRGPLVAWTPQPAPLVVRMEHHHADKSARRTRQRRTLQAVLGGALIFLLGANLWATLTVNRRVPQEGNLEVLPERANRNQIAPAPGGGEEARERFVRALHHLLQKQGTVREWSQNQVIDQYQHLVTQDRDLRTTTTEGKVVVGTVNILSQRSAVRIESLLRDALANKGYDPELIDLACLRVKEKLSGRIAPGP